MKKTLTVLLTLSALNTVDTSLAAIMPQAVVVADSSILVSPSPWSDAVSRNVARQYALQNANLAPTLEQMLVPFNFTDVNPATYFITQGAMAMQLEGRGLIKTGRGFVDTQQIDSWYSAAEDRSVVCVTGTDGGRYSQVVYVTPGKVRRSDATPF